MGVSILAYPEKALKIVAYPNPVSKDFNIVITSPFPGGKSSVQIFNTVGEELYDAPCPLSGTNKNSLKVDMSKYPEGMYLLHIKSDNFNYRMKVLVAR